jgi:hypothetical protein
MNYLRRLYCWFNGHDFPAPGFHGNALCFCTHCGTEIAGRSFDVLEPMTKEESEMFIKNIEMDN